MFNGFHKPPILLTEEGGGGVRNFKQLSLGYAKENRGFFFLLGQEIEWKIILVGGMRNWVSD